MYMEDGVKAQVVEEVMNVVMWLGTLRHTLCQNLHRWVHNVSYLDPPSCNPRNCFSDSQMLM